MHGLGSAVTGELFTELAVLSTWFLLQFRTFVNATWFHAFWVVTDMPNYIGTQVNQYVKASSRTDFLYAEHF
jgi:hypothetical protein